MVIVARTSVLLLALFALAFVAAWLQVPVGFFDG